MKSKSSYIVFILSIICLAVTSCKKYLDARPSKNLVVPSQVNDLQGLLDNYTYMNITGAEAGEIASDNYFLTQSTFDALARDASRHAYLWEPEIFLGFSTTDWQNEYNTVYQANVVLDNISSITQNTSNQQDWNNCKGEALLFRAKSFWEILQNWSVAYDSLTANSDLGIVLRLSSDFNVKSTRASIKQSYSQAIQDASQAIHLLPRVPKFPYRPSLPAAYGLLARIYLSMGDYKNAKLYADSCLSIKDELFDFNRLDSTLFFPFAPYQFKNSEDIMHSVAAITNSNLLFLYARVDTTLLSSYSDDDLRKTIFFYDAGDGYRYFRGTYDGNYYNYNGLATDEIYLIRSECRARLGDKDGALNDLNTLLEKRWKTGTFKAFATNNVNDALDMILTERRKELIYRCLRFSDIKRLNKEGMNIKMQRFINGQNYSLPPNDKRYALPIPDNVIEISGIQQN